jgi:GDP/UDP-N,N'-diacetylbacillosamine 2-epimerase (hydrolysing)
MKKTAVFTSTRAEYGLLKGLIQEIAKSDELHLQLIVSGTHLSADFGMTINEIKADGFKVDESVEVVLSHDTPTGICKSMGLAMIGYGEVLMRNSPDILVILGDRYEVFCAAAAAQVCRVPVAHIHGGEATEGVIDEAFRHSITKMSHLHFASCEAYRQRIIQLGEAPDRVFNVGALGVENIRCMSLMERNELAEAIGFNLEKPYFLVTFHPVTLEKDTSEGQFKSLLASLDAFPEYNVIFTKSNADTDGRVINSLIDEYAEKHPERCLSVASLGALRYLSAMKYATAVIGNSSSGIVEAPSFKIPTVNIGDRQKGRIQVASILNCSPDANAIRQTIGRTLSSAFQESLSGISNPYERPGTCSTIVRLLERADIFGITKKTFHDVRSFLTAENGFKTEK